jgi:hypothetical protein
LDMAQHAQHGSTLAYRWTHKIDIDWLKSTLITFVPKKRGVDHFEALPHQKSGLLWLDWLFPWREGHNLETTPMSWSHLEWTGASKRLDKVLNQLLQYEYTATKQMRPCLKIGDICFLLFYDTLLSSFVI